MSLGLKEEIKRRLAELGKTQNDLADFLGVTPTAYHLAFRKSSWNIRQLEKIAAFLGEGISISFRKTEEQVNQTNHSGDNFYKGSQIKDSSFFSDSKCKELETENKFLKDKTKSQEEEIKFLRSLLNKK